jgi:hypothetical protein
VLGVKFASQAMRWLRRCAGTPLDWALEAHRAAREIAVAGVSMNDQPGADYLAAVRPTLDRPLAAAGLRLAALLNQALK